MSKEMKEHTKEIVSKNNVTEEVTNIKYTIRKFLELFRDIFGADASYLYLVNEEMDIGEKKEILNERIKEMEEAYEKEREKASNLNNKEDPFKDEINLIIPSKLGKPSAEDIEVLKFIDVSQEKIEGKNYWNYDYHNRPRKYVVFKKCENKNIISEDNIIFNEGITAYIYRTKQPLINSKKSLHKHRASASLNSQHQIKPSSAMSIGFPLIYKGKAIGVLTIEFYDQSKLYNIDQDSKKFENALSYMRLLAQLIVASRSQFGEGSYQTLFGGIELLKLLKDMKHSEENPTNEKIYKDTLHLFYVLKRKEYVGYNEILQRVEHYANDISKYLGLTSDEKSFSDFLDKFKKHEELLLYGLNDFRDHFMHQFHVFVSGYIIINLIGIDFFQKEIENSMKLALGREGEYLKISECNVLRIWFLVSFFHDHAYIFEKIDDELQNFFKASFNQDFTVNFNWEQLLIKSSKFPEHLTNLQKFFSNKQRNTNPDALMRNYLDSIISSHDHGVLSALLLLNYFSEYETLDPEFENIDDCLNVVSIKDDCLYAALAISIHNQYDNLMEKNMKRISFESFPIAFLLSYCDNAQSFGRIGKKQKYRIRFSDIKFLDNRIIYELEYLDEKGSEIPKHEVIENWAKQAHNTFKSSKYFFEIKHYKVKGNKDKEKEYFKKLIYTLSYGYYKDTQKSKIKGVYENYLLTEKGICFTENKINKKFICDKLIRVKERKLEEGKVFYKILGGKESHWVQYEFINIEGVKNLLDEIEAHYNDSDLKYIEDYLLCSIFHLEDELNTK